MNNTTARRGRHSPSRGANRRKQSSRSSHRAGGQTRRSTRSSKGKGRFPTGRPHNTAHRGKQNRARQTFDVSHYINKHPAEKDVPEAYAPVHAFADFGIDKRVIRAVAASGHIAPTPIQDQIIPHILRGRDVIGLANTGTGKTAAFLIPLIDKTLRDTSRETLILAPTRELAIQIKDELGALTRHAKIFSAICVGGVAIGPQIQTLRKKNHFIIGTPGRTLDLINRGNITPERFRTVVLDEADRMLDMGFIHDMRTILKRTPKERETLFFSATMSKDIERLVHEFLRDPITVSVKKKDILGSIEQDVIRHGDNKFETLVTMLADPSYTRVLIFGAMKHGVERLRKQLTARGIAAESIHGNKSHPQRQRALKRFKENQVRVLVATDVAARGIHVEDISHVINYDLPTTYEDYVHRIGRTGRGEKRGKALTFVG